MGPSPWRTLVEVAQALRHVEGWELAVVGDLLGDDGGVQRASTGGLHILQEQQRRSAPDS